MTCMSGVDVGRGAVPAGMISMGAAGGVTGGAGVGFSCATAAAPPSASMTRNDPAWKILISYASPESYEPIIVPPARGRVEPYDG